MDRAMKLATSQTPINQIELKYKPLPKQAEFHALSKKYRFFVGGWGNGKTSCGCVEALMLALEYPGSTGLIARRTRPELKATTQHTFFYGGGGDPDSGDFTGCPQELIRSFNKTEQKLTLVNGSIIHFWPLDDPDKLSNLNLGWFLIDQGEEVPEEMFQMLQGRLRQRTAPRCGIVLANPNGHDWIWYRNVYRADQFKDHGMIHAKTSDNPNLPTDYVESLLRMPKAWIERFFEGSFDVFSGQIWPEFDPDVHTIRPFPIDANWEIIEGIDHGRRNPTAVLWASFDEKGNCFIVDEHYEPGQLVRYHAMKIHETRTHYKLPIYTVIDASAAQKDPNTGRSVIDEYWDHGIVTIPSDRHVPARINRIAEWLMLDPNHPHPLTGETRDEGWPRLYIFRNCVNLIEHIQQYQWKKKPPTADEDAKEQPLKKDDHDVDAMGYILMTRPNPSTPISFDKPMTPAEIYWARVRARMDRGGSSERHSMLGSEA
ncbi:MAG: phage terminase large subunit [Patescibacteria group bacterium]|nr:phage terminase large subunit [Patescibacteria group bacterium]